MGTQDFTSVDPDMAVLEDLSSSQTVLLPNRSISVIGLTLDENLTCVENEFAENDCVIALYHVTRKANGDWLIPNPDLPCLVNDDEVNSKVLLSQGTVIHVGDRFMRYHMPVNRRQAVRGAPPKPSRMRSKSLAGPNLTPDKTKRSFSITLAEEWCIIDIGNEMASRQPDASERQQAEQWCIDNGITTTDPLIEAITSAEQLCSIVSSHICHQTMVFTETSLSTNEIDDLFRFIKAMGPGNEMMMTKFVLEYHSYMNEEENMGRALHKPVIALLTDFLKITLEPLKQTEFWLQLLASFSEIRDNLPHFLELGTTPVVLGAMAASMSSESVQESGCKILSNVSSVLPNHNKKGPIRESAVELVLMAVRVHSSRANVIRPACRTLANVTQTYATLIGRILTPEPEDTLNEDNNAVENLARWLGIMEVIQEYGLPIIDAIIPKFVDDVIIQAECRRVIAFFRNNSFQTDSSDDSSTDLPHLEMLNPSNSVIVLTPPDSTRTSISSLSETETIQDTNAINKVINQVMINQSFGKEVLTCDGGEDDQNGKTSTMSDYNDAADVPIATEQVDDEATEDEIIGVRKLEDTNLEDGTFADGNHEEERRNNGNVDDSHFGDGVISEVDLVGDELNAEVDVETGVDPQLSQITETSLAMIDEAQSKEDQKREKKSAWKWFTKLFSAKDKDEATESKVESGKDVQTEKQETEKSNVESEKETLSSAETDESKLNNGQSKVDTAATVNKPVNLDKIVKKNDTHGDLEDSFDDLFKNYANEADTETLSRVDLNEQVQSNQNVKPSTKVVTLQRQKFTLERQKKRLKTLKSVAKGIVRKTRDSYTVNSVDDTQSATKNSVIQNKPVKSLDVQLTSSKRQPSETKDDNIKSLDVHLTFSKRQPSETKDDNIIKQASVNESMADKKSGLESVRPQNDRITLPSVLALAKLYEKDSPGKVPDKVPGKVPVKKTPEPIDETFAESKEVPVVEDEPDEVPDSDPDSVSVANLDSNKESLLPSVLALAKLYEKKKSQEVIPIQSPGYSRLRRRSVEIKSGQLRQLRKERSGSMERPKYHWQKSEVTMDGNEGMMSSSEDLREMSKNSDNVTGESDLVKSGELKIFDTDKDVKIPGGIGASDC